jgi:WD40 repeat protein
MIRRFLRPVLCALVLVTGGFSASRAAEPHQLLPPGHTHFDVTCLAFSPDGKLLATGGDDGRVIVWEVGTGQVRETFSTDLSGHGGDPKQITAVAFRDNTTLLWGAFDFVTRVWDLNARRHLLALPTHGRGLVVLPGDAIVTIGSEARDELPTLWDLKTGRKTIVGAETARRLAVTPDSKTLLVSDD